MRVARLALALLIACAPVGSAAAEVRYIDATLELEGSLLDQRIVDLLGDGEQSLCLALRKPGGERELRIYGITSRGLSAAPVFSVPVLEDVTAFGFADVREEPGQELIFLTRSGAWSYSLTKRGYRGNIERLVSEDLLYDVPDSRTLSYWEYVLPAEGGDLLLLPGNEGFAIWGPRPSDEPVPAGEARYISTADFGVPMRAVKQAGASSGVSASSGGLTVSISRGSRLFLGDDPAGGALLSDSKSYSAPALVDVNGDGELDLVTERDGKLHLHWAKDGLIEREPSRIEEFPDYLQVTDSDLSLEFADVDADGLLDLVAHIEEDVDGLENAEHRILILINDGERLLPDEPRQVLRFEAAELSWNLAEVNGDDRPDLVLRKFELPSMLETVTGLEVTLTHLVFLAEPRGKALFARRPVLKHERVFDENSAGEAIKSRKLELDCNGDGIPDLIEIDLQGRIVIRRLTFDSGFFSGDTWSLDEEPWKSLDTRGSALSISIADVNGDGVCDILSPGTKSLAVFLSQRTR